MIKDLVIRNRSFRRFKGDFSVSIDVLKSLIELARLSPSAANLQPLRYIPCTSQEKKKSLFETLHWASYLTDWAGPAEGERPAAYIILLGDKSKGLYLQFDAGIACQSILLGAVEMGMGGCILGAVDRESIRSIFSISEDYEILYVIALGKPAESVIIEDINGGGDIKYWRDKNSVHHVPKIAIDYLIYEEFP